VNAVLAGRRNNPPDPKLGIPPLAVYNPIHYQELPELFMDYICSLTGKSPSTTGFGSEGALTKGPFNALLPIIDINNALVSALLTGNTGFTTAAGFIGPKYRMDHDNSMLVPEVWSRMRTDERDPRFLIENGFFEKLEDFEYKGRRVLASRLGYRITALFTERFLGRIFEVPGSVFSEELLRPENQDMEVFVAGVNAIVDAQRQVALNYFADESVKDACPPIAALLHIMAYGDYSGLRADNAEVRGMFTREAMLDSEWYQQRLRAKQAIDIALWCRHVESVEGSIEGGPTVPELNLQSRLLFARQELARVRSRPYLEELSGTIGADPSILSKGAHRETTPRREAIPV
jgi:hypothetical protein